MGQSSLVMLEKAVLFGTSVSCGIECLIGGQSSVRLSSLIWDRGVLCRKEESYVRQEYYIVVFCGTEQSCNVG